MLEREAIICFAHDWEGDPTSKTHIMRILSQRNTILWINSIAMRRPAVSTRDVRRLWSKFRRGLSGCTTVSPTFHVWNPLVIPLPGSAAVERINAAILASSIRRLERRLGLDRPILWSFVPNVTRLLGTLGERLSIYHCVDEYAAFSGVAKESLARTERDMVTRADLVFTSSERLGEERRRHNPRTFFVSHGVDQHHFSRALDADTPIPADVSSLPHPLVGFFGLIADWLDLGLIRRLALARPSYTIVLVGKVTTDVRELEGLANVHFVGQKPYDSLPGYCKAFDVGIIPFRVNELTLKANPLKLREYLAAGLPVVSTDLPEVRRYESVVHVARDADAFVAAVDDALGELGETRARQRIDAIRSESWEARVEQLSEIIRSTPTRAG